LIVAVLALSWTLEVEGMRGSGGARAGLSWTAIWVVLGACGGGGSSSKPSTLTPAADGAAGADAGKAAADGGKPAAADAGPPAPPRLFPEGSSFYREIGAIPADAESPALIASLAASGGFGDGALLFDFGFEVVTADDRAPAAPFMPGPDYFRPDCDEMPVPLMAGGALEGETDYQCTKGGECHLLVHHPSSRRLYEMWKANFAGGVLTAGCLAIWDTRRLYGPSGRGTDCASADASGLPIAPLLLTADEIAAGEIRHALRLSLPYDRIRRGVYVSPATHATRAATGGDLALPLGARLRLRADYPQDGLSSGAKVVVRALQRYGMILADGGKALSARGDRFTAVKWSAGDTRLLGERDLAGLQVTDFEVIDAGARIPYQGNCVRSP
jgi:serine/threonine-protein kinase